MKDVLLSVGIDVGTTTSQVVFSNITIEDMSNGLTVPRIEIVGKDIIYRGEIHFTPLTSPTTIDAVALRALVEREYAQAGVDPAAVKTGAVVITGETARKQNADEVAASLSGLAGEFVVATAGPSLESVLAGRGAGADVHSRQRGGRVANYDIGGGTSNFVLFDQGEPVATGCLDIGGRLVRVDRSRGVITYVADKLARLCAAEGLTLRVGDPADVSRLRQVARLMCRILEMSLGLTPKSDAYAMMLTEPDHDIACPRPIQHLTWSGGVADCLSAGAPDPYIYGDIGLLLGEAIGASEALRRIPWLPATETIRATVVGAGAHITKLSGSTIDYDRRLLPIKDVPALKLTSAEEATPEAMTAAIRGRLDWFHADGRPSPVAVAFEGPHSPSFSQVEGIAAAISAGLQPVVAKGLPMVVVTENDLAKVLGQSIRARATGDPGLICIDGIAVKGGDYVDIGAPAAGGAVVPVVVKTLVFH